MDSTHAKQNYFNVVLFVVGVGVILFGAANLFSRFAAYVGASNALIFGSVGSLDLRF